MRNFDLVAGYYEWHLIDTETHETLHNLIDPSELLYHEDGSPLTKDEIKSWCQEELISADISYADNEDYNGIWLRDEKRLDQIEEIPAAAEVMATTLYNYYID